MPWSKGVKSTMIFCPQCGRRLVSCNIEGRQRPCCPSERDGCGFIDFGAYSLGVGGIVVNTDAAGERKILLIQRNQKPNRYHWTLPGGFVEFDEAAEAAVVREVKEETGLHSTVVGLCAFRNRPDPAVNTSYCVFLLRQTGGKLIQGPTDEILARGFYALPQLSAMQRLTPLSRELAIAALTDRLCTWRATTIRKLSGHPPFKLFIGHNE
jgi:ADP-ribose pyrophosphatase YjhB (NUDIX family)